MVYYDGTYSSSYFYLTDLQGDVVALMSAHHGIVAEYTYDAWGNILAVTDSLGNDISGDPTELGNINPLRYRGYFYDTETGFYYLQSRYYDPAIGRFINADGYISTGTGFGGYNMYAYCNNNPVNYFDPTGNLAIPLDPLMVKDVIKGIIYGGIIIFSFLFGQTVTDEYSGSSLSASNKEQQSLRIEINPSAISETAYPINVTWPYSQDYISNIFERYGNLECEQAAEDAHITLDKRGHKVSLCFPNAYNGYVMSNRYNYAISENGKHMGYMINGLVYCNIYPEGQPLNSWVNCFYIWDGSKPIVTIF